MATNEASTPTTGWIIELAGALSDSTLYLSISESDARFGWIRHIDKALMLAREEDAGALALYANARTKDGITAVPRKIEWDKSGSAPASSDLERENDRLRRRIENLEAILSTLRRIREGELARAEEESQSADNR